MLSLDEDHFIEYLPLFRRVFSDLDNMERKRLLDAVLNKKQQQTDYVVNESQLPAWETQQQRLLLLMQRNKSW